MVRSGPQGGIDVGNCGNRLGGHGGAARASLSTICATWMWGGRRSITLVGAHHLTGPGWELARGCAWGGDYCWRRQAKDGVRFVVMTLSLHCPLALGCGMACGWCLNQLSNKSPEWWVKIGFRVSAVWGSCACMYTVPVYHRWFVG